MNTYIRKTVIIVFLLALFIPVLANAQKRIDVHVSILPVKYFVEKIGGDHVVANVLLNPGENPTTYSPSPHQIKLLSIADLFFRIGVPFENAIFNHIKAITKSTIVDLRKGIIPRQMESHSDHIYKSPKQKSKSDESHNHINEGTLGKDPLGVNPVGVDPHIWMAPQNVKLIAHTIFEALCLADPSHLDDYKKNYTQFIKELDELDQYLKRSLKPLVGGNLFVFHPSFGYFTDTYGFNQIAIETMGKAPRGKTLSNIIKLAKKVQTKIIFIQPQFDRNTANKIALSIGGTVVSIDPLAYDYLQNMKMIGDTIKGVLTQK